MADSEMGEEFNLEIVKDFIVSRLGKVTNHELVSHFKPFLSDPEKKAINREKFKDFVNTLASVKEEDGEKVLVLKKKFRKGTSLDTKTDQSAKKKKSKDETTPSELDPSHLEGATADISPAPSLPESISPYPDSMSFSSASSNNDHSEKSITEMYKPEESIYAPLEAIRTQNQAGNFNDLSESVGMSEDSFGIEGIKMGFHEPKIEIQEAKDTEIGLSEIKEEKSFEIEEKNKDLRAPSVVLTRPSEEEEDGENEMGMNGVLKIVKGKSKEGNSTVVFESPGESSTDPDDVFKSEQNDKTEEDVGKPPHSPTAMSVKERAKHLNKIDSESNLHGSNVKMRKHGHGAKDDDSSSVSSAGYSPLDELDREWIVISAQADYHPMFKLLNQKPELSRKKDFITGYSALHWAAKQGKPDIIKLLCSHQGVNVNARSHGGYTPLHLAAMNGHEDIIELLVHGYSADPNMRDYSGKKAKQYLRNSASSRTQPILITEILQNTRRPSSTTTSNFKRSASYSAKIQRAGHFGIHAMSAMRKSWMGGSDVIGQGSRSPSMSPSPSPRSSPAQSPGPHRKGSFSSKDVDLMPPPSAPSRKKKLRKDDKENSLPRPHSEPNLTRTQSNPDMTSLGEPRDSRPVHTSPFV